MKKIPLWKNGVPKNADDWTEEDWRDLWYCTKEAVTRIASRHSLTPIPTDSSPSTTGEDERVAVLLSRLDAVCCILAIVDGSMPTKQELGMAYDELVSVRDDVAGIIRHLPAPSYEGCGRIQKL